MGADFKELKAWNEARILVKEVYQLTSYLPSDEKFCLTMQMRRAVISVSSNIAEGQGRNTPKDFANFLSIARGSLSELMTQLILCYDLGYLSTDDIQPVYNRARFTSILIKKLQISILKPKS